MSDRLVLKPLSEAIVVQALLFQGVPVRFVRVVSILLLVLCLIDVVQDCAISASVNLPDNDDPNHSAALVSVLIVLGEFCALIHSSLAHFALPVALHSVYHPLRQ